MYGFTCCPWLHSWCSSLLGLVLCQLCRFSPSSGTWLAAHQTTKAVWQREREESYGNSSKWYKLSHTTKTQNQTPLGARHPSRVWFRDHHSPGLYWTSQTTLAVWDTVVSETLNPAALIDYQNSNYSNHELTRLSGETIICGCFEQKLFLNIK